MKQTVSTVETIQQQAVQLEVLSRSTGGVEQTKAAKIETETSLQRAEQLEVLGKTKEERLRQGKSTTSRATGNVEQNKARFKIEIQRLSQGSRLAVSRYPRDTRFQFWILYIIGLVSRRDTKKNSKYWRSSYIAAKCSSK